jgi:hypothetical protein
MANNRDSMNLPHIWIKEFGKPLVFILAIRVPYKPRATLAI